jgi:hypothetical protein
LRSTRGSNANDVADINFARELSSAGSRNAAVTSTPSRATDC